MLLFVNADIFTSQADVLVNPVNCQGKMGRGLALEFRNRYPQMYTHYKVLCENHKFNIGNLLWYKYEERADTSAYILCFPTKDKWRRPSKLWYIEEGLKRFVNDYPSCKIKTAAFPKLGCGLGGLDYENQVRPLLEQYLQPLTDLTCFVYEKGE